MKLLNVGYVGMVGGVLIAGSIILFLLYNYVFACDFPFMDDFMLILFVQEYADKGYGPVEFINKLFQSANSHKMVIPRLVSFFGYLLSGELNFRAYQLIVSLNILLIIGLFYNQFRKLQLNLIYFVPVVFFLLHPQYYDITLWGLTGIQHTSVVLFTLVALNMTVQGKPKTLAIAIFLCFLSTFSHGNGLFAYCAVLFYLFAQKKYKEVLITLGCMILSLGIFLYKTNDGSIAILPDNLKVFSLSFLAFIGSTLNQSSRFGIILSGGIGLFLLLFLGFRSLKFLMPGKQSAEKSGQELYWLSFFAFIVVTALVVSLLRSWSGLAIASRFQIYGALSLVVGYMVALITSDKFRNRKSLLVIIPFSILLNMHSYYYYSDTVLKRKSQFLADVYNWKTYGKMFSVGEDFLQNADYFFTPAYEEHLVLKQNAIVTEEELVSFFEEHTSSGTEIHVNMEVCLNEDLRQFNLPQWFILSNAGTPGSLPFLSSRLLVLKSLDSGRILLLSATPVKSTQSQLLRGEPYYVSGFNAFLREKDLKKGRYQVGVLDVSYNGDKRFYKISNELIKVSGTGIIEKQPVNSESGYRSVLNRNPLL